MLATIADARNAEEAGRSWLGFLRRNGPTFVANRWHDMSYAAGRSRWLAGSGLPSYAGALQDWTRTEVATGMPKRIGVPIGYGGASLALPRIAGSLSSWNSARITLTATGSASRGLDVAGSADITIGASGSVGGVGAVAGTASISIGTAGDVYGQAAVAGSAGITIGASGDVGGVAFLAGNRQHRHHRDLHDGLQGYGGRHGVPVCRCRGLDAD
jgi:hypothetical protein